MSSASLKNRAWLTVAVNNLFDRSPPAGNSCDSANFDPATYDMPDQFDYLCLSFVC